VQQKRGYGALLRVPGFGQLYISLLLGRLGGGMLAITLILFVLARYNSPQLAGFTAFLAIFPGLVVSPIAGALLDRRGRVGFITLDYLVATASVLLIAGLAARNALPAPLLLVIVGVSSLTNPLSNTGLRSLFPIVAPREMWERANALDSSGYLIASLVGAPLAGALISLVGPEWTLAFTAALFAISALAIFGLHDPSQKSATGRSILGDAWSGLVYVARNATLRGLALTLSTFNVGFGILEIAIPVLVLSRLHSGPATVGVLWGIMGGFGLVSALLAGRIASLGRERQLMVGSMLLGCVATAMLPLAGNLVVVVAAVALLGLSTGPFDIGLFTLRQRRTDARWFGRAFAVSMALNSAGNPIGSAIAGPLIAWSLNVALWAVVAICLVAAVLPQLAIPAHDPLDV